MQKSTCCVQEDPSKIHNSTEVKAKVPTRLQNFCLLLHDLQQHLLAAAVNGGPLVVHSPAYKLDALDCVHAELPQVPQFHSPSR
jgi:hypothetical protein